MKCLPSVLYLQYSDIAELIGFAGKSHGSECSPAHVEVDGLS